MKPICLNEEQIIQLQEMARVLFPEKVEQGYSVEEKIKVVKHQYSNAQFIVFERESGSDWIPWLEFCILYLQPALRMYIASLTIKSYGAKYIDMLYDHFKITRNADSKGTGG